MDKIYEAYKNITESKLKIVPGYKDNEYFVKAPNGAMVQIVLVYKNNKYAAHISVDDKLIKIYKNVPINYDIEYDTLKDLLFKNMQNGIVDKWMKTIFKHSRFR